MKLHDIALRRSDGFVRLAGDIEHDSGKRVETYFAFPEEFEEFVSVSAEPFAAAMLAPAMAAGERLTIAPPISPQLSFELRRVHDVMAAWFPEFRPIDIETTVRDEDRLPPADRAATFFSGGVDSFYTLLKHQQRRQLPSAMTHVIFMRGIETRLELVQGFEESQRRTEAIARAVGVQCIVGETNIRTTSRLHWEKRYVGSGLAATALALARGFGVICIPSGASYHDINPRGSSPLIDERLSIETLRILFDGAEVSRAEKVGRIVEWDRDLVLTHLRVCIENSGGAYNCGECYKCVRTAVALEIAGAWSDATGFRNRGTAHWERSARKDQRNLVRENQEYAHRMGAAPWLTGMLDRVMRGHRRRDAINELIRTLPLDHVRPVARRIRERLHRT